MTTAIPSDAPADAGAVREDGVRRYMPQRYRYHQPGGMTADRDGEWCHQKSVAALAAKLAEAERERGAWQDLFSQACEYRDTFQARAYALERRLELYATTGDGKVVKLEIGDSDGIGCRNETIKLLDQRIAHLVQQRSDLIETTAARIRELEALCAARNQQSAAAFGELDEARGLLRVLQPHRIDGTWALLSHYGPHGEGAHEYLTRVNAFLSRATAQPETCATCGGSGLVTVRGMCGGVEMDCDDQMCGECAQQPEGASRDC